ncbi:transposase [Streptomyces tendae]|uniref:transposase n=1 Tax=Streptomyces tendae TaxID=1932 RepID=UPI00369AE72B
MGVGHRRRRVGAGEEKRGTDRAQSGRPWQSGKQAPHSPDAQGLPMVLGVSAANVNDVQALVPLILGLPAVRSRRGPHRRHPGKLRADKAYHSAVNIAWLRQRNITPRIARPGVESSERLGRHRWKIERSISWLFGYRRLTVR